MKILTILLLFCSTFAANAITYDKVTTAPVTTSVAIYIRFGQPSFDDTSGTRIEDTAATACTGQGICEQTMSADLGDYSVVPAELVCVAQYIEGIRRYTLSLEIDLDVIPIIGTPEETQTTYFFEAGSEYTFYGGIDFNEKMLNRLGLPLSTPDLETFTTTIPDPNDSNVISIRLAVISSPIPDVRTLFK